MRPQRSIQRQAGATMVELAIILPVFVMFIFGLLDLVELTRKHAMLEAAAVKATEFGGRQSYDCLEQTRRKIDQELERWGLAGYVPSDEQHRQVIPVSLETGGLQGVQLTLQAKVPCTLCSLFGGRGGALPMEVAAVSPMEHKDGICLTEIVLPPRL